MRKLLLIALLFVAAVPVMAQKVKVDSAKTVDLSKFKTYSWAKGTPAKNPMVNQLIIDFVEQQLAKKGLTKVESNADLSILFWATSGFDLHVSYADWGWSPAGGRNVGIPINQAWNVPEGSLEIDVFERESHNLLWRATATDTLKHAPTSDVAKDAKDAEKQIKKAIEKMFKKFP
jgi:Domain of unknown function (DUF4136)